jgi:hypothetical protein
LQKFPSVETVPHFQTTVIPGEPKHFWRDPWFDKLTTLSEVEGEFSAFLSCYVTGCRIKPALNLIGGPA